MNNKLSIIIPVRNEETNLPRCISAIKNSLGAKYTDYEIITVINRCEDNSEGVAKDLGCKIIHGNGNLSQIRNAGARAAEGNYLFFIDADSLMHKDTVIKCVSALDNNCVGGGTWIIPDRLSLGIILTGVMLAPFIIGLGLSGGMFYCNKNDFFKINGFDETVFSAEDLDFSRRLKDYGNKVGRLYKTIYSIPITTSCRKFDHFGDWFFVRHPIMCYKLLRNQDPEAAKLIWYNFQNKK